MQTRKRFTNIALNKGPPDTEGLQDEVGFRGMDNENSFTAGFPLFLIREAVNKGMDVEDLADGFGAGLGTNGDWSAIRDSTDFAVNKMFERALNHIFGS